jgi:hypothetical protein
MAIEMTGGRIVNERGTVVTFRQRCEACGYVFDWNKTTIVPAYGSRKVRPFTCPSAATIKRLKSVIFIRGRTRDTHDDLLRVALSTMRV